MMVETKPDGYRLSNQLASMDLPDPALPTPTSAGDLLAALVQEADAHGRYYGEPRLIARIFWASQPPWQLIARLLDELIVRGDVEIRPDALSCYSGAPFDVLYIVNRFRWGRYKKRAPLPPSLRAYILDRDYHQCRHCGSPHEPQIDHIHPISRGGAFADPRNLQVLCGPCNRAKSDMDADDYMAELLVCSFKGYCKVCVG